MKDELTAARLNVAAMAARATIEGMIAENQMRAMQGHSQAYGSESFFAVRDEIENLLASYWIKRYEH